MLRFSEKNPLLHVMTQDTSLNKDVNVHTNVISIEKDSTEDRGMHVIKLLI